MKETSRRTKQCTGNYLSLGREESGIRQTPRAVTAVRRTGGVFRVSAAGRLLRSGEAAYAVSSHFSQCDRSGADLHGIFYFPWWPGRGGSHTTSLLRADVALARVAGITRFPVDDTHSATRFAGNARGSDGGVHCQPHAAIHARKEAGAGWLPSVPTAQGPRSILRRCAGPPAALRVTPARSGRPRPGRGAGPSMQKVTGGTVEDWLMSIRGYTGPKTPAEAAQSHGIRSKWSNTPWRNAASCWCARAVGWSREASSWAGSIPQTRARLRTPRHDLKGFHYVAFACLMIANMFKQTRLNFITASSFARIIRIEFTRVVCLRPDRP